MRFITSPNKASFNFSYIMQQKPMLQKILFMQYNVPPEEHIMDFNLLKIFVKLAESSSLTQASKALGMPKSTVSRELAKLETDLKLNLFSRSPRGIKLTSHGRSLLSKIKGPIEELEISVRMLISEDSEMQGEIKITAPEDLSIFILTKLIIIFMQDYPKIKIKLCSTNEILDFNEFEVDMALRIGKLSESSLIQKRLAHIDVGYMASANYISRNNIPQKLEDLQDHSLAILSNLYGHPIVKAHEVSITPHLISNSMPVLKEFIKENKGIATITTFFCKEELAKGEFIHIFPEQLYTKRSLYLLTRPNQYIPKHVKLFKEFLIQNLPAKISE